MFHDVISYLAIHPVVFGVLLLFLVLAGVGGWYVINGETEVGTVVAFVSGLNNVHDPWGGLVNWYEDMMVTRARYRTFVAAMVQFAKGEEPLAAG